MPPGTPRFNPEFPTGVMLPSGNDGIKKENPGFVNLKLIMAIY
jgi:hypothetical protein